MKEEHHISITSELIDGIHKMKNSMEESENNVVYRCGKCKNILNSMWFCEVCNYQYDIITSTRN